MKRLSTTFAIASCLYLGTCCGIPYPVDFHNDTPSPVRISYATVNMFTSEQ